MNLAEEIAFRLEGAYYGLPSDRKRIYDELEEELWPALYADAELHEGCVPGEMHELPSCGPELHALGREAGYEQACADVLERLEALGHVLGHPRAGDMRAVVARISSGVRRLKERGPE